MKILIADDEVVSQLILSEQLKSLGHTVSIAADGREAWELYLSTRPQLVITDWIMPNINGLEFSRMIRAENREIYTYIIFLTILNGKGSYLEAMDAGADDFITKPFDVDQLAARLHVAERILGLQREIKQLQGLLPICSYCKRIREEDMTWLPIEKYITQRTDALFSHGVCPDCYEQHLRPEIDEFRRTKQVKEESVGTGGDISAETDL
ncbi:MAG: response regulator [Ignavibacteriales bacterium]|nr:response regulator [Ignavibacteriales bacterium]